MPLMMIDKDPASVPLIICDACGKPINSCEEGNYHWGDLSDPDCTTTGIYYSHRSMCSQIVDRKFKTPCAMNLDDLLLLLIKTLKFNLKKAKATRAILESIG